MGKISIEVSPREHQEIKTLATLQGKSIRQFMLDLVFGQASAKTPNQETIAAIEEARADSSADHGKSGHQLTLEAIREVENGGGTRYKDVKSMLDDVLDRQ
jgi:hypothetical protein